MNTPYDKDTIKSYILHTHHFYHGNIKRISTGALKLAINEADKFLRYICTQLKYNNIDHFLRSSVLSVDMVERLPLFMTSQYLLYQDILVNTCFDENHLKHRIMRFMEKDDLEIEQDAYVALLTMLHKRFDNMISIANSFRSLQKKNSLDTLSIRFSRAIVKYCLEETWDDENIDDD